MTLKLVDTDACAVVMAILVNGKLFQSYSAALNEYLRVHIAEHDDRSDSRTVDHLASPETLLTSPTRRMVAMNRQSPDKSNKMGMASTILATPPQLREKSGNDDRQQVLECVRPSLFEGSSVSETTPPSATDDLCHCSVLYGVDTPRGHLAAGLTHRSQLHVEEMSVGAVEASALVASIVDTESMCTEELLSADSHGSMHGRQPSREVLKVLRTSHKAGGKSVGRNVVKQKRPGFRVGLTERFRKHSIDGMNLSDSMETLKRVLFHMQQVASEYHCVDEVADNNQTDQ